MSRAEIVSIGYEGRTQTELVDELTALGASVLIDVRMTPLSRKPGLSRTRLASALSGAGIEYRHLRALGNPQDNRDAFRSGNVAKGCAIYRERLGDPAAKRALQEIVDLSRDDVVAVLCYERDHERCHRQVVLDEATSREPRRVRYA